MLRGVIRRTARGRDARTPIYAQIGVIGVVGVVVIIMLAIAFPLYYAYGGK